MLNEYLDTKNEYLDTNTTRISRITALQCFMQAHVHSGGSRTGVQGAVCLNIIGHHRHCRTPQNYRRTPQDTTGLLQDTAGHHRTTAVLPQDTRTYHIHAWYTAGHRRTPQDTRTYRIHTWHTAGHRRTTAGHRRTTAGHCRLGLGLVL